jgi:hypothetical protein
MTLRKLKSDLLVVRLEPALLARFRRAARADNRDLSAWVRLTLDRASLTPAGGPIHESASTRGNTPSKSR